MTYCLTVSGIITVLSMAERQYSGELGRMEYPPPSQKKSMALPSRKLFKSKVSTIEAFLDSIKNNFWNLNEF